MESCTVFLRIKDGFTLTRVAEASFLHKLSKSD